MTMATPTRPGPVASRTVVDDLDRLSGLANRLCQREPRVDRAQRAAVLSELFDVDLALERLTIRASQTILLDAAEVAELRDCSHRLHRLHRHW